MCTPRYVVTCVSVGPEFLESSNAWLCEFVLTPLFGSFRLSRPVAGIPIVLQPPEWLSTPDMVTVGKNQRPPPLLSTSQATPKACQSFNATPNLRLHLIAVITSS